MNRSRTTGQSYASSTKWREVKKASVAPYYTVAISWIIFALFFPMYSIGHFITIILISVAELVILKKLIKPTVTRVPLPYEAPTSGTPDADKLIETGAEYIRRFDKISAELSSIDCTLADKLCDIRDIMNSILEYVAKNPEKLPRIRRFMSYYLPTLEKLMNTYLELSAQKTRGENIDKTLTAIEGILDTVKPAFERLLNDLYEDRAIDIGADINVLKTLLKNEGLADAEPSDDESESQ